MLPEFRPGYVLNRKHFFGLKVSLYRKRSVDSLLIWVTQADHGVARGDRPLQVRTCYTIFSVARRELLELIELGLFERKGRGPSTVYVRTETSSL